MKKCIRFRSIINIINVYLLINYTTGLVDIKQINLEQILVLNRYLIYIVFIFSFVDFLKKIYIRKLSIRRNLSILLFSFGVLIISIIATNSSREAIMQSVMLIGTAFYAIYLANTYEKGELFKLFYLSQFIIIIFTLLFSIIYPEYGQMYYENKLVIKGAFEHKNLLGANAAFGVIVSVLYYKINNIRKYNMFIFLNISLNFIILILTNSATSIISLLGAFLIHRLYSKTKIKINYIYILALIHIVVYTLANYQEKFNDMFLKLFNRDLTLTGRTTIWKAIIEIIKEHELIGYGYNNNLWQDNSPIKQYMIKNVEFPFTGSHNGFLEWILCIGIIGVVILIILLLNTAHKTMKVLLYDKLVFEISVKYTSYMLLFYISERLTEPISYQILMLYIVVILVNNSYYELKNNKYINYK